MRLADFASFFVTTEDAEEAKTVELSREILDWTGQAHHKKFMMWLNAEASKPLVVKGDLVEAVVRVNTFREIEKHLKRLESEALSALKDFQGE